MCDGLEEGNENGLEGYLVVFIVCLSRCGALLTFRPAGDAHEFLDRFGDDLLMAEADFSEGGGEGGELSEAEVVEVRPEGLNQRVVGLGEHPVVAGEFLHDGDDLVGAGFGEGLPVDVRELSHQLLGELSRILNVVITLDKDEGGEGLPDIQVFVGVTDHLVDLLFIHLVIEAGVREI